MTDLLLFNVKLALLSERYDDMVEFIRPIASLNKELTVEERELFSISFRNKFVLLRSSLQTITLIENKLRNYKEYQLELMKQYREKIATELMNVCNDVLSILDQNLIPFATANESKVLFLFFSFQNIVN